jgi:hypothetical protein
MARTTVAITTNYSIPDILLAIIYPIPNLILFGLFASGILYGLSGRESSKKTLAYVGVALNIIMILLLIILIVINAQRAL